ncbi:Vacuolar sorting protein snf7, putative [Perkinsus marinus ATCC 50983]|uniref:Vacuolar sorting protein snf7, putative n=1 Tax=Perkinsus marinus (strain ATCC 50983 / TXsc) TaxID=423536 RepID=C5L6Q8_PERM5|nr:Vacuolar sorting protein snf7, putative [Perkinsus marinus ATCC 50983]EER07584.1 Vacuolar sorting protein snf7, putative [Perkinsus marinus ATCC 50983]|eukprot:XP_002775768.1 Vacuolar sorting protein snf7, putative [Perkinsus marinus ATCC 50983]
MRLFFGKKKEQKKSAPPPQQNLPDAIMKNKEAIETLEKRELLIEKKMAIQEQEARMTLEQQILSLESSQTTAVAVQALSQGVSAQKTMNQQLNIDNIDELMDDMAEQQDLQNEVSQVLSSGNQIMDDDELLNELDQIEAEELDKKMVDAVPVPSGGVVTAPATSSAAAASVKAPKVSDGAKSNASTTAETSKWGNEAAARSGSRLLSMVVFGLDDRQT